MRLIDPVPIPTDINRGVSSAKQQTMIGLLGMPRGTFSQHCQPVTNPVLGPMMETADVGPFRVTGLAPAVMSLKDVMADLATDAPEVLAELGTAGMLCCRLVRDSATAISNHSWGTAVDLTIDGVLDRRGDGSVQHGLTLIHRTFNRHGWFWGAGFRTEDGMHFEVCDEKIKQWHAEGLFGRGGPPPAAVETFGISLGDRGPEVRALQAALNANGNPGVEIGVDGIFGPQTRAALMAFQSSAGLPPTGIADRATLAKLGLA